MGRCFGTDWRWQDCWTDWCSPTWYTSGWLGHGRLTADRGLESDFRDSSHDTSSGFTVIAGVVAEILLQALRDLSGCLCLIAVWFPVV